MACIKIILNGCNNLKNQVACIRFLLNKLNGSVSDHF